MGDFTTRIGPGLGFGGAVLISLGRIPAINRRMLALFEPLVRWCTRGAIAIATPTANTARALSRRGQLAPP